MDSNDWRHIDDDERQGLEENLRKRLAADHINAVEEKLQRIIDLLESIKELLNNSYE